MGVAFVTYYLFIKFFFILELEKKDFSAKRRNFFFGKSIRNHFIYWEVVYMNKAQLVGKIAGKSGLTKKDAEKALNAFVASVQEALVKKEKVQLIGFGTFEVKERAARMGRNPQTGAAIKIAASKAPVFKVGKALKDAVNKKKK